MKKTYQFNYGKEQICLEIEESRVVDVVRPRQIKAVDDPDAEFQRALREPIGSPGLSSIVRKGEKVAVIASNFTRPSPNRMVAHLVEEIENAGVKSSDISIVFAGGLHRLMTVDEERRIIGEDIHERYRVIQHDPRDSQSHINLGKTSFGTPIEVNRFVYSCDRIVCSGFIEPSYLAGFTGGRKSILPGLASERAITINHRRLLEPGTRIGRLEGNTLHQDMEEFAERVGIDFILNQVVNDQDEMVMAVAGDFKKAHRVGVEKSREIYEIQLPREVDIVITNPGGYPYDVDLVQAKKAIIPAQEVVREGGVIILIAQCCEGWGAEKPFRDWIKRLSPQEIYQKIKTDFVVGGHGAYLSVRPIIEKKAHLIYVTSLFEDFENTFIRATNNIEEAMEIAESIVGRDSRVCLLHGARRLIPK